jgi:two-component system OmpR family response regulator
MRVLVIEDDSEAADYIQKALRESGHTADIAGDGEAGLAQARDGGYDILVVDRMLPKLDGLTLIRSLREDGIKIPTLILSALGDVDDRVKGLRAGGDDYLTKPYAFSELLARLEALLRRGQTTPADTTLRLADLEVDLLGRTATRGGKPIDLLPREFQILEYLMRYSGQVVTRTMLLENVWNYHFDPKTSVIDVQISRLRQKLDKGFDQPLLHTVRGAGYCLRAPE